MVWGGVRWQVACFQGGFLGNVEGSREECWHVTRKVYIYLLMIIVLWFVTGRQDFDMENTFRMLSVNHIMINELRL